MLRCWDEVLLWCLDLLPWSKENLFQTHFLPAWLCLLEDCRHAIASSKHPLLARCFAWSNPWKSWKFLCWRSKMLSAWFIFIPSNFWTPLSHPQPWVSSLSSNMLDTWWQMYRRFQGCHWKEFVALGSARPFVDLMLYCEACVGLDQNIFQTPTWTAYGYIHFLLTQQTMIVHNEKVWPHCQKKWSIFGTSMKQTWCIHDLSWFN